jgi:hypothetical protein
MEGGVCLQYRDGKVRSNLAVPYGASGRYEDIVLPAMAETAARCAGVIGGASWQANPPRNNVVVAATWSAAARKTVSTLAK